MSVRSRAAERLRRWLLHSSRARQASTFVLVLTGGGALATAALALAAHERGRPLGDLSNALVLAVPAVVVAQLWVVLWGSVWRHTPQPRPGLRAVFGPLDPRLAVVLASVGVVGACALALTPSSGPVTTPGRTTCTGTPQDASYICNTLGVISHPGLQQALTEAVFFAFFVGQFGVALGARRTQAAAARAATR